MKMVKSLLLGSAAGLVALSGAQAADLPVKAKAVEYVKVCSAYGAGFYYIPGTDICLRVGGYVRADYYFHNRAGAPQIYQGNLGSDMVLNRDDTTVAFRSRGVVILDARTNTAYGTLRSYFAGGATVTTNATGLAAATADFEPYLERAFIQFAGFTFGYTVSFFDMLPSYGFTNIIGNPSRWTTVFAYTANLGNGVSATIAAENATSRRGEITNHVATNTPATSFNSQAGARMPDIVANVRADQAWGSFQASVALKELRANATVHLTDGHVSGTRDTYGYAAGAGIEIKTPSTGAGDSFTLTGVWSKGAYDYTGIGQQVNTTGNSSQVGQQGNNLIGPVGDLFDAFVSNSNNAKLERAEAWSVAAQFRHFWTPALRSSIGVGYFSWEATPSAHDGVHRYPHFKMYQVQSTHIWSPVKNLDLGVEVIYSNMKTDGGGAACGANTPNATAINNELCEKKGVWSGMARAQRNF